MARRKEVDDLCACEAYDHRSLTSAVAAAFIHDIYSGSLRLGGTPERAAAPRTSRMLFDGLFFRQN